MIFLGEFFLFFEFEEFDISTRGINKHYTQRIFSLRGTQARATTTLKSKHTSLCNHGGPKYACIVYPPTRLQKWNRTPITFPFPNIIMRHTRPTSFAITYGSTDSYDQDMDTPKFAIINNTAPYFVKIRESESSPDNSSDVDGAFKCWMILLFAILLEVAGTTSMKISDEFTKLAPSVMIYVFYGLSFYFFPLSLKRIDLSTSYAVWSGLGTVLTCMIGFFCFSDTMNTRKIIALTSIILGCVALKFAD